MCSIREDSNRKHVGSHSTALLASPGIRSQLGPLQREPKAQPLAMAVTLPSQGSTHASDAMDVDREGRCPPIKCFNCGKLGHTSRFCKEKRIIQAEEKREEEELHFVEESQ